MVTTAAVTEQIEKSESRLRAEFEKGDRVLDAKMTDAISEMRKSRKAMERQTIEVVLLNKTVSTLPDETGIHKIAKSEAQEQLKNQVALWKAEGNGAPERLIGKAVLAIGAKIGAGGIGVGVGFAGIKKLFEVFTS
jgi:hypothetical protein